ncbi:Synaptobrevin [Hexamita inflata]|uniref:Synaptobrevin n=1 Tax=Hexamita inflata TaxID=28002 RepID=A0AA86Q119_9EUKA|nr:Synaptobrevin [Hexamita inflata]
MSNVLAVALLRQTVKKNQPSAVFLGLSQDLSKLNSLVRSKAGEFVRFACRQTASVLEDKPVHGKFDQNMDFIVHGLKCGKLCMVVISNQAYPIQTANRLMKKQVQDVMGRLPTGWAGLEVDSNNVDLKLELAEYKTDSGSQLNQLQVELDETKQLVFDNIQGMMQRNRKLDEIVADSEDLSAMAKEFANDTKKLARCRCFGM